MKNKSIAPKKVFKPTFTVFIETLSLSLYGVVGLTKAALGVPLNYMWQIHLRMLLLTKKSQAQQVPYVGDFVTTQSF